MLLRCDAKCRQEVSCIAMDGRHDRRPPPCAQAGRAVSMSALRHTQNHSPSARLPSATLPGA